MPVPLARSSMLPLDEIVRTAAREHPSPAPAAAAAADPSHVLERTLAVLGRPSAAVRTAFPITPPWRARPADALRTWIDTLVRCADVTRAQRMSIPLHVAGYRVPARGVHAASRRGRSRARRRRRGRGCGLEQTQGAVGRLGCRVSVSRTVALPGTVRLIPFAQGSWGTAVDQGMP